MERVVRVHYGGSVKESSNGGSKFEGMSVTTIVFPSKPSFEELVSRTKDNLDWSDEVVCMQGRYDVGGGPISHKQMLELNGETEWEAYVEIVKDSQFKSLDVVATKEVREVRKGCIVKAKRGPEVDEPHLYYEPSNEATGNDEYESKSGSSTRASGRTVVPDSEREDTEDLGTDEPRRNDERVEGDHDYEEDFEQITDSQKVSALRDLMRQGACTYSECAEALEHDGVDPALLDERTDDLDEAYKDEYASNSEDDRPVCRMSMEEREVFKKVVGRDASTVMFEDLSNADLAVADGDPEYDGGLDEMGAEPRKGLEFRSMDELKIWLQSYSIRVHRPYRVKYSDAAVRYTVSCQQNSCKWEVRARKGEGNRWKITGLGEGHTCGSAVASGKHLQLTSNFIGNRLQPFVRAEPTISAAAIVEAVELIFKYHPSYGKAWRAKQAAMRVIFGEWDEAYVRLPTVLNAMKARNPSMYYCVEPHPEKSRNVNGVVRRVFGRAAWIFGQAVEAFVHLQPVLVVDGTFLTGKFGGTLLTVIGIDAGNSLVPLAFALVEKESTPNWRWFLRIIRLCSI